MPKQRSRLGFASNERVFITGQTGSGKTVLAREALKNLTRLIVIDTKGELTNWNTEEYDAYTEHAIRNGDPVRVRILPPLRGDSEEFFDEIFFMAYEAGNICIFIDEMYGVVLPGSKPMDGLSALYTRGRSRGVGIVAASQRPTWVPLFAMSEAGHFFVFRLNMPEDRRRLVEITGQLDFDNPIRDPYGFFYYRNGDDDYTYVERLEVSIPRQQLPQEVPSEVVT